MINANRAKVWLDSWYKLLFTVILIVTEKPLWGVSIKFVLYCIILYCVVVFFFVHVLLLLLFFFFCLCAMNCNK